ncbi:MAG TPA: tRNA (adenosine(37)-N6)-threonylcarbamoyltransferase complex dimerization subunit type 1 TsaB [Candidatus Nitrosopolaris sp.]|nr:tRNA (adenosine(37)-N6)-threonylcarbamoyltransferase complex dimerization subunit type 1 TsaB [Candidatus Nitrosopolaris sp.]
MIILTLRTDKPEAEVGVFDGQKQLAYEKWLAHLRLAETLNHQIEKILNKSSISAKELQGIVCYKGPGSFTGLRIGLSVANVLAYSYNIPIVATGGKNWVSQGIQQLQAGRNQRLALPEYGRPATITKPHK